MKRKPAKAKPKAKVPKAGTAKAAPTPIAQPPPPPVMGRPTKYEERFCDMLINHMKGGLSFESFAAKIRVNQDTLHEWAKAHPDFSEAKKEAYGLNLLFYEKAGITGMMGRVKNFNATTWIFNMKNRHRWHNGNQDPGEDPIKAITEQFRKADEALKKKKLERKD